MSERGFIDRMQAGRELAGLLERYAGRENVVVLALPRGGVPVAAEVAKALGVPFDLFFVRKLGVPGREELALGAIASGGVRVLNDEVVRTAGLTTDDVERIATREREVLERQERELRAGPGAALPLEGRTVILVDDGLATGSTMRAAAAALRERAVARSLAAVPVASPDTCAALEPEVDEIVCAFTPDPFLAVGTWYDDFTQVGDDEVRALLRDQAVAPDAGGPPG